MGWEIGWFILRELVNLVSVNGAFQLSEAGVLLP